MTLETDRRSGVYLPVFQFLSLSPSRNLSLIFDACCFLRRGSAEAPKRIIAEEEKEEEGEGSVFPRTNLGELGVAGGEKEDVVTYRNVATFGTAQRKEQICF